MKLSKTNNYTGICDNNSLNRFFKKINKINNFNCFLGGAYVIEDPGNKIFHSFTDGCSDVNRDRGIICITSHASFLKNSNFQNKRKSMYKIDDNNPLIIVEDGKKKYYSMFEKVIKNGINVTCKGFDKKPGVLLYYPFTLKYNNDTLTYLYVKYETHPCFELAHLKSWAEKLNNDKKIKKGNGPKSGINSLVTRREDEKYTDSMKQNDNEIYIKYNVNNTIDKYNKFVRTGAEFYIPNQLWNKL